MSLPPGRWLAAALALTVLAPADPPPCAAVAAEPVPSPSAAPALAAASHDIAAARLEALGRREGRLARRADLRARRALVRAGTLRRLGQVRRAAALRRRAGRLGRAARGRRDRARRLKRRAAGERLLARRLRASMHAPSRRPAPVAPLRKVPLGTAVFWRTFAGDAALESLFLDEFESLTPENELKWSYVQPEPGVFAFEEADELVGYALAHGKRVRGHTLVYGRQLPGWLTEGEWSRESLLKAMREHIHSVIGRYRGRIHEWDVVNEAIGGDGTHEANLFMRVIGQDYVEHAFRYAHEADPTARLFYNDSGIGIPDHPSTTGVLRLLRRLKGAGVPVHGVGIQAHQTTRYRLTFADAEQTMRQLAALGLDTAVTEADVAIDTPGTAAQQLERQRQIFEAVALACRRQPRCKSFTTWGMTDRLSWLGASNRPLPFDSDLRQKPAWSSLVRALRG